MPAMTLRVRFSSGHMRETELDRLHQWHVLLRQPQYGHVESIEPWRIQNQTYRFTGDSVEFDWYDPITMDGLAEAARDLGGMVVERKTSESEWEPVKTWKAPREGILDVINEERKHRRESE